MVLLIMLFKIRNMLILKFYRTHLYIIPLEKVNPIYLGVSVLTTYISWDQSNFEYNDGIA